LQAQCMGLRECHNRSVLTRGGAQLGVCASIPAITIDQNLRFEAGPCAR
jgi:hypothetical protein